MPSVGSNSRCRRFRKAWLEPAINVALADLVARGATQAVPKGTGNRKDRRAKAAYERKAKRKS